MDSAPDPGCLLPGRRCSGRGREGADNKSSFAPDPAIFQPSSLREQPANNANLGEEFAEDVGTPSPPRPTSGSATNQQIKFPSSAFGPETNGPNPCSPSRILSEDETAERASPQKSNTKHPCIVIKGIEKDDRFTNKISECTATGIFHQLESALAALQDFKSINATAEIIELDDSEIDELVYDELGGKLKAPVKQIPRAMRGVQSSQRGYIQRGYGTEMSSKVGSMFKTSATPIDFNSKGFRTSLQALTAKNSQLSYDDFMSKPLADLQTDLSSPDDMLEAVRALREHLLQEYPEETAEVMVDNFIVEQFRWLETHHHDIEALRYEFKTPDDMISLPNVYDDKRYNRRALLNAVQKTWEILRQLKDLNSWFPSIFPRLAVATLTTLDSLRPTRNRAVHSFETGFRCRLDHTRFIRFVHKEADRTDVEVTAVRDAWLTARGLVQGVTEADEDWNEYERAKDFTVPTLDNVPQGPAMVYYDNLAIRATWAELNDMFQGCIGFLDVEIPEGFCGISRGFGFATFTDGRILKLSIRSNEREARRRDQVERFEQSTGHELGEFPRLFIDFKDYVASRQDLSTAERIDMIVGKHVDNICQYLSDIVELRGQFDTRESPQQTDMDSPQTRRGRMAMFYAMYMVLTSYNHIPVMCTAMPVYLEMSGPARKALERMDHVVNNILPVSGSYVGNGIDLEALLVSLTEDVNLLQDDIFKAKDIYQKKLELMYGPSSRS